MVVRNVLIDRGDLGQRVDRVLMRHLHDVRGLSRNTVQRLITSGAVLINDRPAPRVSWRIAAGDRLSINLPDASPRERVRPERLPLDIVFEDEDLLVVNKPAGQVAHPAFRNTTGTLLNGLVGYAHGRWIPALVSRLDKDTSGLVLISKQVAIQAALQAATRCGAVHKDYLAVVAGNPRPSKGTIDLALGRDPFDRRRVTVRDRGGQPSVTRYQRLATSPDGARSLLKCRLVTGRTHQIRVHLAAKGWPIVGDAVYGVKDPRIARQALHAWRLSFTHPNTRERVDLIAPIPADMEHLVETR